MGVVRWCEGVVYLTSLGLQLKLAYSWARPAILVAGKSSGGMFLFLVSSLSFLFLFLPCPSLSSHLSLPPFLWERTQNDPQGLTCH